MNIKKMSSVFFSATGSTEKVLDAIAGKLPWQNDKLDITCHGARDKSCDFLGDELVIFGVPVYGGRVPAPAVDSIKNMHGNQTPAILVATYGNRAYDDALLEMKNLTEANGFITVAAAAFVTEHSIMHSVARGRPDTEDMLEIYDFAARVRGKLEQAQSLEAQSVPGNMPYKQYGGVPLKPTASAKACTKCGVCALNCPVGAIPMDNPSTTDKDACISCMRCIALCPANARKLNPILLGVAEKAFFEKCKTRRTAEMFL